ncbi:MAG: sulfate ABC transporter permease subunit CysW [Gemmataceae bacterium]
MNDEVKPEETGAAIGSDGVHRSSFIVHRSGDPPWVRWLLTGLAVLCLTVLVIIPVVSVFVEAFADGVGAYLRNLTERDTLAAVRLTLVVAPAAVLLNLVFGVAAAWAIARFRFPGRTALVTLIDLPFSVSPVVVGLVIVLIFAPWGYLGPTLQRAGVSVLFTPLGLVLATTFVTLPFVARELIPVMEAIGPDEELAALSLGASPRQMFWRITLPNIKWGLLYGVILCNARAMGEFGAVYVVGGRIAGETNTMPLQVEMLFAGFNTPGAFAVASVLTSLGLVTLALKTWIEGRESGIGGRESKDKPDP